MYSWTRAATKKLSFKLKVFHRDQCIGGQVGSGRKRYFRNHHGELERLGPLRVFAFFNLSAATRNQFHADDGLQFYLHQLVGSPEREFFKKQRISTDGSRFEDFTFFLINYGKSIKHKYGGTLIISSTKTSATTHCDRKKYVNISLLEKQKIVCSPTIKI